MRNLSPAAELRKNEQDNRNSARDQGGEAAGVGKRSVPTAFVRAVIFRRVSRIFASAMTKLPLPSPRVLRVLSEFDVSCNHPGGAGGATAASVCPLALSARATKPEAFISSTNSRK